MSPEDFKIENPGRKLLYAGVAVIAFSAMMGSWFTVDPNERAGVRTFGTVTTSTPLTSGLHFKLPFFSSVDRIVVSQQKLHIDPFSVNTIDNQPVTLEINIIYRIPDASVFRLMYQTGGVGSADISSQIGAVVRDRAARIIASKNTVTISANREAIQAEITQHVKEATAELFGIDMESLQIPGIGYSQSFMASNDLAVQAKNAAVAEENKKMVIQYQAQQRVIAAEGQAREQVAQAEGAAKVLLARSTAEAQQVEIAAKAAAAAAVTRAEAEARQVKIAAEANASQVEVAANAAANARRVQAEAERTALEAVGHGEGARLKAMVDATGGADKYLESLRIGAQAKWNGSVPTTVMNMGSGANGSIPLVMTMPAPGGNK
jgi:regulator of protease activity HflC (stomatin/prohibitin superfamily)